MQTIASLAERLDMTATQAVEVLQKLHLDIKDVETEIDDDTVDLLLDVDEDESVLEEKVAEIEKKEAEEREKAARAQKAAEKRKAKTTAKKKTAAKKPAAKKSAAKKTAAKKPAAKKTAAKKVSDDAANADADTDVSPEASAEPSEIVKTETPEIIAEPPLTDTPPPPKAPEAVEAPEPPSTPDTQPTDTPPEIDDEAAISQAETASQDIAVDNETVEEPQGKEAPVIETPSETPEKEAPVTEPSAPPEKHVKPAHPLAEILVDATDEEDGAAEKAQQEARNERADVEMPGGSLAQAEKRHEAEERRRAIKERERREKLEQEKKGPVLSAVQADPDIVAEVIRRNEERKRKTKELSERPRDKRKAQPPKGDTLAETIGTTGKNIPQDLFPPKGPPKTEPGTSKTAKKRAKRAERLRMLEDGRRREAAAAVKEFQAGTVGGGPRKRRKKQREATVTETSEQTSGGIIEVDEMVTVESLAALMDMPVNDLILALMDEDILANKNQSLDMDTVRSVAAKHNYEVHLLIPEEEELFTEAPDAPEDLRPRPPVVTVMGHVDHGKTSLLDAIRTTNVADGEAGGITQHIAAYEIETSSGKVAFLDTPGHEAFTQMRARGTQVTDLVVLVVAANDGVKPQTVEAIDHAKAAEVPIVVAINKCDLDNAQPDRVRQELSQYGLIDEAWGGKTMMMNISAKMKRGVDELMEMLALQTELLELKANPNKSARGTVIESEMNTGLGPTAWILIQSGTLRPGDTFIAGNTYGRVRTMMDCHLKEVQEATPSMPVLVTGFDAPADAGDTLVVTADERIARNVADKRTARARLKRGPAAKHMTLEDFHTRFTGQEQKTLKIIIKADVQGSVDVLLSSFAKLGNEEVTVDIVHAGVGSINESDVLLASASDAVIIGFHVVANTKVKKMAETEGVDIRSYRVIYEALDEVRNALEGMLTPDKKEVVMGHAEVREVFHASSLGTIAGCYQTDGESQRGSLARLIRDGVIVHEGRIGSLRRVKDDVKTVAAGFECGIRLERFNDIHEGDIIESFKIESVAKTLSQEAS